ncbi:MAG: protein kinase domain-containing protein [Terriglobia bacterium]
MELGALKIFKVLSEDRSAQALPPESENYEAAERLRNEIAVLSQDRAGLPTLLDSNLAGRWIVTEYFHQGTLEHHPTKYEGEAIGALKAFRSLVQTVASLHKDGYVHRDIEPGNIFVRNDDDLVLGDFGIVYVPTMTERVTQTGERVGLRDFMPSWGDLGERLERVHANFDVYMLGKLLWCMIAGRLKLPREYHKRTGFDLAELFPSSPEMHIINSILDRCVVEDPNRCLESAQQLLLIVDESLAILGRGGQLLSDGVSRHCRVCGKGRYKVQSRSRGVVGDPKVTLNMAGMPIPVSIYICDSCGHVQLFR